MPDQHMTIHKDGRTVTIDTDDEGDRTVTSTGTDQATGESALTTGHVGQPIEGVVRHRHDMEPGAAFFMGMIMGAFILWLLQRERRRRRHRPDPRVADVSRDEVAALARRTATLEQIVTDPATRTAREIDALR